MTKKQNIFYTIAFALCFFGVPAVIEGSPLLTIGMIAASGVCVHIAGRK